jgi:multiple sugar transport system permease protein
MKTFKLKINLKNLLILLGLIFFSFFILFPVCWLFLSALLYEKDLMLVSRGISLPIRFTLSNFIEGISGTAGKAFIKSLINSIIISVGSTLLAVPIGSLAAFSITKLMSPRYSNTLFNILLFLQAIPAMSVAIPIFIMIRALGLFDTYLALIICFTGFSSPYIAWMLIGFFEGIPNEIFESALLDGCNIINAYLRIMLPLTLPGLMAVSTWMFIAAWGEFLFSLLLTSSNAIPLTVTISSGIYAFYEEYSKIMAHATLAVLPPILVALLGRKYLIRGIIGGGIKG